MAHEEALLEHLPYGREMPAHEHRRSPAQRETRPLARRNEGRAEAHEARDPRAIEVARSGGYPRILETLRAEALLEKEAERVRGEYELDQIEWVNENDREMFAILDLYDPGTARHCYETYKLAKEKMEKEILPGVSFAKLLREQEGVSLEQFYRACLFHDIGKVEVPWAVIHNDMDESTMLGCMHHAYHELFLNRRIPASLHLGEHATDAEIDCAFAHQHQVRCVHLLPARDVLSSEDLEEVKRFGFTGEETLFEIIQTHEFQSGKILANAGRTVESKIAASHHNYAGKSLIEFTFPLAIGALRMSVNLADVLHLADIEQALSSPDRSYKRAFSMPKVMNIIVEDTRHGKIDPMAAFLWLTDEMQKYETEPHEYDDPEAQAEDEANLAAVRAFLAEKRAQIDVAAM